MHNQDKDSSDALSGKGQRSPPVSGVISALEAGSVLRLPSRMLVSAELPAYLAVQMCWFGAFGLQMVLYPYLIVNTLEGSGVQLGIAQMALSAPSVFFLLIGGVVAERTDGRKLLIFLHLLACLPPICLAVIFQLQLLAYSMMLIYGIMMGIVGAFMMPARDAILNKVIDRRMQVGSKVTLQQGIALATVAQFAAQILGLTLGGYADKASKMPAFTGGMMIGPIDTHILLYLQSAIVASGAIAALLILRGLDIKTLSGNLSSAIRDIGEGFTAVKSHPRLRPMVISMFGVGLFVIGSFLVVLPVINRDIYGFSSNGIRDMYVTFWLGAFISSIALSVFRQIKRPGRLLLTAQGIGSLCILTLLWQVPHHIFLLIVFLWGLSGGISISMSRSIVQTAAPPDKLARILSIYQLGFMGGAPLGAALMGLMIDVVGLHMVAIFPAMGMITQIIWMFFFTPIWNMSS